MKQSNKKIDQTIKRILAEANETEHVSKLNAAKKGKYIRIKCWTAADQSSMETHAKSVSEAIKILNKGKRFHANWVMEFISE